MIFFTIQEGVKVGAAAPGEGVLANFFNSLLSKKTNAQAGKSTVRQDASAELEKMTRTKKLANTESSNSQSGTESS